MSKYLMVEDDRARKKAVISGVRAKKAAAVLVSDEYVTATDVAERLGTPVSTARVVMQRARELPGKVTWERLTEIRQAMVVRGRGRAKEA